MRLLENIYSTSFTQKWVVNPIGRFVAHATAGASVFLPFIKNVKKDEEIYKAFYLTKIEVVERNKLSPLQRKLLAKNEQLSGCSLYLATFAKPLSKDGMCREREFFVNADTLRICNIVLPNFKAMVGNGTTVLSPQAWNVYSIEQNWGTMRMQAIKIEKASISAEQQERDRQKLEKCLKKPENISRRPFFWFVSGRVKKGPRI